MAPKYILNKSTLKQSQMLELSASEIIKLGLILDAIGVIVILIPIIERTAQRLRVSITSPHRDYNPWDFTNQNPNYHRRNDIITMIGIGFLFAGFILQFRGNS